MPERLSWIVVLMVLCCVSAPQPAAAEAPAHAIEEQPESGDAAYDNLIKKALIEFNLSHWGEAKAYFLRAHQLRPSARTLRSLGLTSYEQRLYVSALGYLRQALASQERPLTPEMRAQVQNEIEEARSFVSRLVPVIEPKSVKLLVDGQPAVFDEDGTLIVDPGQHELLAEAPGFVTQTRPLTAHGADRSELRLTLQPAQPSAAEPFGDRPATQPERQAAGGSDEGFWATRSTPQWVGIGLAAGAVVAVGVGAVFGLLALDANSDSKQSCTGNMCFGAGYDARERALTQADIATVSFIGAGVLAAGAAVCYFAIPGGERQPAAWRLTPMVAHNGMALTASGSF